MYGILIALLSHEMLLQVMRTHGFNPSEEDLRDMIRNVDKNANGAIDFNEFIEMMLKQGRVPFRYVN